MSRIDVVPEDGKFKIMINYVKRGVALSSSALANNEASRIKSDEMPHASIFLIKTEKL
jgi:hypothetical protein